jgi:DNA topoisomerase II
MGTHMIPFATMKDQDRQLIDMAFSKKKTDERKDWLRKFKVRSRLVPCSPWVLAIDVLLSPKPGTFIDHSLDEITYDDFINRELILFSMADNIRSIPSVVDGLKPGQRKILFGCFKRKLKDQIKVSKLTHHMLRGWGL